MRVSTHFYKNAMNYVGFLFSVTSEWERRENTPLIKATRVNQWSHNVKFNAENLFRTKLSRDRKRDIYERRSKLQRTEMRLRSLLSAAVILQI